MLKTIDIGPHDFLDVPGVGTLDETAGAIIKQEKIVDARRAGDLVASATTRADAILAEARRLAREEREAGFHLGVQEGVRAAMSPVLALLAQLQQLGLDLRVRAADGARAALADLLGKEPALAALLDMVLEAHLPQTPSSLRLCVSGKTDIQALRAHCAELGLDVSIEIAPDGDVFAVGWEGHLWEVRLDSLCGPSRVGSAALARTISDTQARAICRDALLAAAERLAPKA